MRNRFSEQSLASQVDVRFYPGLVLCMPASETWGVCRFHVKRVAESGRAVRQQLR